MMGVGSVTDAGAASLYMQLGANFVVTPGGSYGPDYVKAVLAPQPWTSIMPTGGVTPDFDNLKKWFDAGVVCVGLGSQLMVKDASGKYDVGKIEQLTKQSLEWIKGFKKG